MTTEDNEKVANSKLGIEPIATITIYSDGSTNLKIEEGMDKLENELITKAVVNAEAWVIKVISPIFHKL